jgi:hypothetical protein
MGEYRNPKVWDEQYNTPKDHTRSLMFERMYADSFQRSNSFTGPYLDRGRAGLINNSRILP